MSKDNPDREARLAQALRANLRRRKAQSREQAPAGDEAGVGPSPSPTEPPSGS